MENDTRQGEPTETTSFRYFAIAIAVLILATVGIRSAGITRPLLGNFATKNIVNAMIARNLAEGNTTPWYPMLDMLQAGQPALVMIEFPVSTYLVAALWKTFGGSLDAWGRGVSVFFSAASVWLLCLYVRRRHGPDAALGAGTAMALSPVSIIYGQSFMLESSLVFFTVATLYAVSRWSDKGAKTWLLPAASSLTLLLLTKVYMAVVLLPLAVDILRTRQRRTLALATLLLATVPAIAWYAHAYLAASPTEELAERIYFSVRRSTADHFPPSPLLSSPDFYRQLIDDITGVVLTPIGFTLVLLGFFHRAWRSHAAWVVAMALLIGLLPRKFHEMNYYFMAWLPTLCILAGLGWQVVAREILPGRKTWIILLFASLVLSARFAVHPAFLTPKEDQGVIEAARAIRRLTREGEPVVTLHGTGIDLLYYSDRRGWALEAGSDDLSSQLSACVRHGVRYVAVVGPVPATLRHIRPMESNIGGDGNVWRVYRLKRRGL